MAYPEMFSASLSKSRSDGTAWAALPVLGCPPQHTVWKLAGETCPQSCVCCAHRWSAPVLGLGLRSWGCDHDPMVQLAQELPPPSPLGLYLEKAEPGGGHIAEGPAMRHKGTCPRSP